MLDRTTVAALDDLGLEDVVRRAHDGAPSPGWDAVPFALVVSGGGAEDVARAVLAARLADGAPGLVFDASGLSAEAPGVLCLPSAVSYPSVPPVWAPALTTATAAGRILLALPWARDTLSPPLQVAEAALRGHLDEDQDSALHLEDDVTSAPDGSPTTRTTSTWSGSGRTWRVVVDSTATDESPPAHTVVEVGDTSAPGRGAQAWDARHQRTDRDACAVHPLVAEALADAPPGTALDVACGRGRHALWLARRGWQVTGLDFSRTGLAVAESAAARAGAETVARTDWQLGDARVWTPPHTGYDLVLVAFVQLADSFARVVRWVRPGGRLVVVGHAPGDDGSDGPRDPRLRHDVVDLAARATGGRLRVLRAAEVERDGERCSLLVAVRPHPRS